MTSGPLQVVRAVLPFVVYGGMIALLVASWYRLGRSDGAATAAGDGPDPCSHCGYDVRGGLERCPECGRPTPAARRNRLADLRTRWPTETLVPRPPTPDEQPVVVLTTDESPAADLLRQHLQARGITARTTGRQTIINSHTGLRVSRRLIVWSADEERARAIIARLWSDVGSEEPDGGGPPAAG